MLAGQFIHLISLLDSNKANGAYIFFILWLQVSVTFEFFNIFFGQASLLFFNHLFASLKQIIDLLHITSHLISLILILFNFIKETIKICKLIACCPRKVIDVVCLEAPYSIRTWQCLSQHRLRFETKYSSKFVSLHACCNLACTSSSALTLRLSLI